MWGCFDEIACFIPYMVVNPRPSPWQGDVLPLYYALKKIARLVAIPDRFKQRDPQYITRKLALGEREASRLLYCPPGRSARM